jgi:hypothetical protein
MSDTNRDQSAPGTHQPLVLNAPKLPPDLPEPEPRDYKLVKDPEDD